MGGIAMAWATLSSPYKLKNSTENKTAIITLSVTFGHVFVKKKSPEAANGIGMLHVLHKRF